MFNNYKSYVVDWSGSGNRYAVISKDTPLNEIKNIAFCFHYWIDFCYNPKNHIILQLVNEDKTKYTRKSCIFIKNPVYIILHNPDLNSLK